MLTNNKKSFFVKGIALLMAMLMVLSVCLTGCGKAAEEAAKNAQDTADKAVTDAAAAQSAADAVKKELEKYFTSEQTKTEAGKLIEEALKAYTTTEGLAAYVKSDDFDALVAQLNDYVKADAVNAAIAEALEGKVTAAELEAIQKQLSADIKKNQTAIADAVESLKGYATDAEIAAIQAALEKKIADGDKAVKDALAGYATDAEIAAIQAALEKKITDGDKAVNDALKGYVKNEDLVAVQSALNDKIAATDKAIADAVASLEGYVKADEYALLVSSVQEMTFKLQTIDREHYGMVMETLAPYVENQEALAASVQFLMDELSNIDKKHHDHIVELLADYVTAADYDLLVARVQALDVQLNELHMNVKNELAKYATVENFDLLTARVQALDVALEELHMNVKNELAKYATVENFDLLAARVQALDAALTELHMNVKNELADHDAKLESLFAMIEQHKIDTRDMGKEIQGALVNYATKVEVDALEGRLDRLEEVVRGILNAFYTPEEVKTFAEEGFDILDVDPAIIAVQFQNKMNTVDGSMSLADWNATTTTILVETIDNIQKLLEKLYVNADGLVHNNAHKDAYLYARKMAINAALNVTANEGKTVFMAVDAFDPATGNLNDSYTVRKGLEYAVLRSGSAAQLKLLSDAIAKALDVNNFAEDLQELYDNYLYTIGCADDTHHKNTQIVTFEHKGEINTFADKFDGLIISYLYDTKGSAFRGTKYEDAAPAGLYNFGNQPTKAVYKSSANGKLYTYPVSKGASFKSGTVTYTRQGYTIIFGADGSEWKVADWCGLYYLPTNMNQLQWNGAAIKTVKVDGHHGSNQDIWVADKSGDAGIYNALIEQSYDCQNLINTANAKFKQFLNDVVKAYGVSKSVDDFAAAGVTMQSYAASNFNDKLMGTYQNVELADYANIDKVSDIQFLYALTVAMCTPVAENAVTYSIYLTGTDSVQYYMTLALARNTCVDADHKARNYTKALKDQFYRYDLYEKMIDKAWYITFELYRTYAYEMTLDILADYISVLDYAIAHKNPGVDANLDTFDDVNTFLTSGAYDITNADRLTDGFLEAFLNGTAFAGWTSNGVATQSAIVVEKDFTGISLNTYYGALNNKAVGPDAALLKADPIATINTPYKAQTYAYYIRQYLQGASVAPQLAIMEADRDAAKEAHYDDISFVFEEILASCVASFDEIYFRFLLEDYQKVMLNKAWADATETATFYCLDTETAPLIKSMQNYLTSCDEAKIKVTVGANNFLFANLLMNKGEESNGQLPNGSMYQDIFAIDVDIFQEPKINEYVIDIVNKESANYQASATNKRDLLAQILGEYMVDLDNMAIKYNFMNYLDDATQNLTRAQLNYSRPVRNGAPVDATGGLQEMINNLVYYHNGHNTVISIYKFQEELGQIPFNFYFTAYGEVLNLIASDKQIDAGHLEELTGKTVDTYIFNAANASAFDMSVGIRSTLTKTPTNFATNIVWVPTDLNNVVTPVDILGTGAIYVGEAVRDYDYAVNTNTQYYTDGITTKPAVNLY